MNKKIQNEKWKIQLEKEKQIAKEFKTIKNKWIKNWELLIWKDKQIGLMLCLDEEPNDTYKLQSSYENKNNFCYEGNCRKKWKHFVKCESLDSFFHLCDYHIKKLMIKYLTFYKILNRKMVINQYFVINFFIYYISCDTNKNEKNYKLKNLN